MEKTAAEINEMKMRKALHLIKIHITEQDTQQNRQLHKAIQLIVDVVRDHGYLDPGSVFEPIKEEVAR